MADPRPDRHGTRTMYKRACRCLQCRRANASYHTELRRAKARGQRPKGSHVPAARTWHQLRAMQPEFGGEQALAIRLGLCRRPELRFNRRRVRFETALKVHALYCEVMPIDLDAVEQLR